jgi:glycosyltransferase involved in cell wall biosynthesis
MTYMPTNISTGTDLRDLPIVSVVIPTHNRAQLVSEAIDSVYQQEGIGKDFKIEIIVVDDASTDSTSEVINRCPAVRYIKFSTNLGPAAARNAGIRASTGKYVAFLDDDDIWLPHRLRVQVPVLEAKPAVGVVYGHGYTDGDGFSNVIWPDARWGVSGHVFETFLVQDTADVFNMDTVLVRREAFDKAGLFDQSLKTMEHHDMMLRLAFYFPFEFIEGPVSRGRLSKHGLFLTSISGGMYEQSYRRIIEKALGLLPDVKQKSELCRKARTSAFAVVADLHWEHRFFEQLRSLVLRTLKECPWMLTERPMLETLHRLARRQASDDGPSAAATYQLLADLKSAAENRGVRARWRLRQVLADLLIDSGIVQLRKSAFNVSASLFLASLLRDPSRLFARMLHVSVRRLSLPAVRVSKKVA